MTDVFDLGDVKSERFLISNHETKCGKVRYLDETTAPVVNEIAVENDLHMTGGMERITGGAAKSVFYPSLNDMADSDIKDFIDTCHIADITSNHKPNSIFIIPDSTAMSEIKKEINEKLNGIDPKSADAAILIKSQKLLYKLFIIDSFGKEKDNQKYEYRLPTTYPEKFKDDVIYRRTCKYDYLPFFAKLEKDGIKLSTSADMSNSVECKYRCSIGKAGSNYISFVFTGNVIPLAKGDTKSKSKKYNVSSLFKKYLREEVDIDAASEKFVGAMIKNFGVDKCLPYYSSNMMHAAFAMATAFGNKTPCTDCDNCAACHGAILKKYCPKNRRTVNRNNMDKLTNYAENYCGRSDMKSSSFFKSIRNGYMQIMPEVKDTGFFNNEIAADIACSIYSETNNIGLAMATANDVKESCNGSDMSNYKLRNIIPYLAEQPLIGISARQYYPMVEISNETVEEVPEIKGGEPNKEDSLDLEFTDNDAPAEEE